MEKICIVKTKQVKVGEFEFPHRNITSPKHAVENLQTYLEGESREHFVAMYLNTKNAINAIETLHIGTLNASFVSVQAVIKGVLDANAAGLIISHNHPSGDPKPSNEDVEVTQRIKEACELFGIELLDHIIIAFGSDRYTSFKEMGYLD